MATLETTTVRTEVRVPLPEDAEWGPVLLSALRDLPAGATIAGIRKVEIELDRQTLKKHLRLVHEASTAVGNLYSVGELPSDF